MPEDFASEHDPMPVSAHKDVMLLCTNGGDNATLRDLAVATLPHRNITSRSRSRLAKIASDVTGLDPSLVARGLFLPGRLQNLDAQIQIHQENGSVLTEPWFGLI
jgi:hypothetical protein